MKLHIALSGIALMMAATAVPAVSAASRAELPQRMAQCIVSHYPQGANVLLRSGSAVEANRAFQSLTNKRACFDELMDGREYSPQEIPAIGDLRGALAEQALRKSWATAQGLAALPVQQKRYMRPWFAATGRNAVVDEMAACLADSDPAGVVQLIETRRGSFKEGAAFTKLRPGLDRCLIAGTKVEADATALRAALADALYQRVNNPALSLASAPELPK